MGGCRGLLKGCSQLVAAAASHLHCTGWQPALKLINNQAEQQRGQWAPLLYPGGALEGGTILSSTLVVSRTEKYTVLAYGMPSRAIRVGAISLALSIACLPLGHPQVLTYGRIHVYMVCCTPAAPEPCLPFSPPTPPAQQQLFQVLCLGLVTQRTSMLESSG